VAPAASRLSFLSRPLRLIRQDDQHKGKEAGHQLKKKKKKESNLQYPLSLRGAITDLIALSRFDTPFSPPGHLYLLPSPSLLYFVNLSGYSRLWRTLRELITG